MPERAPRTGDRMTYDEVPMVVKRRLMRLPTPLWKRVVYPAWVRWYRWVLGSRLWQHGSYEVGDIAYWRGVRLVCCTGHYCGGQADHPWDPGWGWGESRAAALWEPARRRDRVLLRIVGDKRVRQPEVADA